MSTRTAVIVSVVVLVAILVLALVVRSWEATASAAVVGAAAAEFARRRSQDVGRDETLRDVSDAEASIREGQEMLQDVADASEAEQALIRAEVEAATTQDVVDRVNARYRRES